MQGTGQVSVPLRAGKKMRKRRELDALAPGGRRLLAGSSDEREDPWPLTRRTRHRRSCAPAARACAALLLCACATATAVVVWLFIDVREQISSLRTEMELVTMGSQGVGDALQRCHSTARELQHNHTEMAARLDKLSMHADNLTSQVAALQLSLANVKQQVASAPELVNVPQQLSSLGTSVAGLGSQIKDFDAAIHAQTTTFNEKQDIFAKNLTQLKDQIDRMWNKSFNFDTDNNKDKLLSLSKKQSDFQNSISQMSTNISLINETLATKIDWATQDFKNDHHKVSGLLESVQNNSAALSSLQTVWRQQNDIMSHNLTELTQKVAEKTADLQREMAELKRLMKQLETTETKLHREINSNSVPADVAAGNEDSLSTDVLSKSYTKKSTQVNSSPPPSYSTKNVATTTIPASHFGTGKPNILIGSA